LFFVFLKEKFLVKGFFKWFFSFFVVVVGVVVVVFVLALIACRIEEVSK
jgi:hypothetical protein